MREQTRHQQATDEADARSAKQDEDRPAEHGADDLEALRAQCDADALLPHAFRDGVGSHAEDAGTASRAAMRPMTPRTTAAVRAGIMERSMASLQDRTLIGAVVTTWESALCSGASDLVLRQGRADEHGYGPETMYGPMPCA